MRKLWPFFCYYGGKWRAAPRYPRPRHDVLIEPFAGAAGYATRYHDRDVTLLDADPIIAGLWRYLIAAKQSEIEALPSLVSHVDDVKGPQEAKWLIGFWLNNATTTPPRKQPSKWMRDGLRPNSFWGDAIKLRISTQVDAIRHWKVIEGGYEQSPDIEATWFIDPPYNNAAGQMYRHRDIDYVGLSRWCLSRRGQVIVCENTGADWLPFSDFGSFKSTEGRHGKARSREAIYVNK